MHFYINDKFLHTIFSAIFMLFLYKELKVDESFIGIVLSVGSIGSIIASFILEKLLHQLE